VPNLGEIPITVHNRPYPMSDDDNRRALEGRLDCRLNKLISLLIYIRGGLVDANDLRTINEYRVIGNA